MKLFLSPTLGSNFIHQKYSMHHLPVTPPLFPCFSSLECKKGVGPDGLITEIACLMQPCRNGNSPLRLRPNSRIFQVLINQKTQRKSPISCLPFEESYSVCVSLSIRRGVLSTQIKNRYQHLLLYLKICKDLTKVGTVYMSASRCI